MIKKLLIISIICILLCGCDDQQDIKTKNDANLASGGKLIGTLDNGYQLKRFDIVRETPGISTIDYVYILVSPDTNTIEGASSHYQLGKTKVDNSIIILNGEKYQKISK